MTREVTIPLSWTQNIVGTDGVDDVTFELVEPDDVIGPILDQLPDEADIGSVVREELDDALADGVLSDIDGQLDIDVPGADAVADAVLDRLDITPGLFGPLEDPLDEVIRRAVIDGLEDLGDLDVDLGGLGGDELLDLPDVVDDLIDDVDGLIDDVGDLGDQFDDLDVPGLDDIRTELEEALREVVPTIDGVSLFDEPGRYLGLAVDRGLEARLDEDTLQELRDLVED